MSLTEGLGHAYDHRRELGLDHDLEKGQRVEVYKTPRNQETHFFKEAMRTGCGGGDLNTRFFHATVIRH